jgi:hypothetical protein
MLPALRGLALGGNVECLLATQVGVECFPVCSALNPLSAVASAKEDQPTTVLCLRKPGREFVEWYNENKFRR